MNSRARSRPGAVLLGSLLSTFDTEIDAREVSVMSRMLKRSIWSFLGSICRVERIAGRRERVGFESRLFELGNFVWSISKARFREFEGIGDTEEFSEVSGDGSKIMVLGVSETEGY